MALITCEECGKDISDQAAACPGCGAPAQPAQPAMPAPSPKSLGDKKVGCGTVIVVFGLLGLLGLGIVTMIDHPKEDPVATAFVVMRRQVAADIELKLDLQNARVNDPGGDSYYVCGEAVLNRPGPEDHPMTMNNVQERYIVTVYKPTKAGTAYFDGAHDTFGKAQFQLSWNDICATAAPTPTASPT